MRCRPVPGSGLRRPLTEGGVLPPKHDRSSNSHAAAPRCPQNPLRALPPHPKGWEDPDRDMTGSPSISGAPGGWVVGAIQWLTRVVTVGGHSGGHS